MKWDFQTFPVNRNTTLSGYRSIEMQAVTQGDADFLGLIALVVANGGTISVVETKNGKTLTYNKPPFVTGTSP
jgi:hypothetical protein